MNQRGGGGQTWGCHDECEVGGGVLMLVAGGILPSLLWCVEYHPCSCCRSQIHLKCAGPTILASLRLQEKPSVTHVTQWSQLAVVQAVS